MNLAAKTAEKCKICGAESTVVFGLPHNKKARALSDQTAS
jgi:hypothetical protein